MDNSECKANFILPELAEAGSASHWKILLFSRTKRRKPQRCTWEWHLKNKRKTNVLLCMTRISRCLQHTFSSSLQLKKENYFLRSLELDSWLSSKLKKTTKIYLTIYLVSISSSYLLTLLQFQHGRQNLSFDVRPLRSRTCDVTFGFVITSGCRSSLKNVWCLTPPPYYLIRP